jgi:beta-glucanase (GH16 family)
VSISRRHLLKAAASSAALASVLALPEAAKAAAPKPIVPISAIGRKVLFRDMFPGTVLSGAWQKNTGTNVANKNIQQYVPEQVQVDNGLKLVARHATAADHFPAGYTWASGKVTLLEEFLYGRFVVEAELPTFDGFFPAVAMYDPSTWPPEIDPAEWEAKDPKVMHQTVHWKDSAGTWQAGHSQNVCDIGSKYHIFDLWWTPEMLVWGINGAPVYATSDPLQIPTEPLQLTIDFAVSAEDGWGGGTSSSTPKTAAMKIRQVLVTDYE